MHNPCTEDRPRKECGSALRRLSLAAVAVFVALPALAQSGTLTLEQVERKYRKMSVVHILKCDRDRDGQFTKSEQLCVASIYDVMYLNDD